MRGMKTYSDQCFFLMFRVPLFKHDSIKQMSKYNQHLSSDACSTACDPQMLANTGEQFGSRRNTSSMKPHSRDKVI